MTSASMLNEASGSRHGHLARRAGTPYAAILAAVDEHTSTFVAARYALAVARASRARLSFVHVSGAGADRKRLHRAESALERLFLESREEGVEADILIEPGEPVPRILEIVEDKGVGLVFAAATKEDFRRRPFARTVARDLLVTLPCAVALVRVVRLGKIFSRNILVPLRGRMSRIEERASFVAALAQGFHSSATLFHAAKPITRFFHGEVRLTPAEREGRAPREIEEFRECLERHGIPHEKRTDRGTVSRSITIEAARQRHDLIVMGASERTILRSLLAGDPVEEVLRDTPCNLIVYRPTLAPGEAPRR